MDIQLYRMGSVAPRQDEVNTFTRTVPILEIDVMLELPKETQGIYVVYPPGKFTQPKVRAFIDYLAQTFARKGPDHW